MRIFAGKGKALKEFLKPYEDYVSINDNGNSEITIVYQRDGLTSKELKHVERTLTKLFKKYRQEEVTVEEFDPELGIIVWNLQ